MAAPRRSEIQTLFLILGVFLGLGLTFWGVSEFLSGVPRGVGGGSIPIGGGGGEGGGGGVGEEPPPPEESEDSESGNEGVEGSENGAGGSGSGGRGESFGADDLTEAERVFQESLLYAEESEQNLLLRFSAPWCPGCWQMTEFLERREIRDLFEGEMVEAEVDLETVEGAKSLLYELAGEGANLPWYALFDYQGDLVAASTNPEGEIPFPPRTEEARDRFLAMFEETGAFSLEEVRILGESLDDFLSLNLR